MTATSHAVTSADGTTIGYSTTGTGPAVVLVDGAFCSPVPGREAVAA